MASAAAGSAPCFRTSPEHVDEIAFLMSVKSKTNVHGPASYLMNTGFVLPGFPVHGRMAFLRARPVDR